MLVCGAPHPTFVDSRRPRVGDTSRGRGEDFRRFALGMVEDVVYRGEHSLRGLL